MPPTLRVGFLRGVIIIRWTGRCRLTSYSGHELLRLAQGGEQDAVLADVGHQGGTGAGIEAPPDPLTGQGRPGANNEGDNSSPMTHAGTWRTAPPRSRGGRRSASSP